ncbi:YkgJ family cysteine cluster protein [Geobacter pickeringii]|uniref:Iron-sulfur cluster-binding oxidoreductase n=1 Tax=Geobacter pickeringii TaxID=345632 RepID=A0A0B5BKD1_9BACT|nr:YkgJ family cysteine cluster protein [Geobacter pickeringii]AJE04935.1 iron-sulfur cluster-binding oxidoreductase [Geobacter pickeringii]
MSEEKPEKLNNYRALIQRVDALCQRIEARFADQIVCRKGCSDCCRHLSLFPVEGAALAEAVAALPPAEAEQIRSKARQASSDGPCPLLADGACLLYAARPLICRTHGMPLITAADGERRIDFCPLNFQGVPSLPGDAVIDLDRLNEILTAVNALFIAPDADHERASQRVTIADALRGGT